MKATNKTDTPVERLSGSVERVTFHSEESGFCVLRAKVKGQRELKARFNLFCQSGFQKC
jgi:exodeoxyribonuclease V alpha subunit